MIMTDQAQNQASMIKIEGVSKTYGQTRALQSSDLTIPAGQRQPMELIDRTINLLGEVIRDKKTMVRFIPYR